MVNYTSSKAFKCKNCNSIFKTKERALKHHIESHPEDCVDQVYLRED